MVDLLAAHVRAVRYGADIMGKQTAQTEYSRERVAAALADVATVVQVARGADERAGDRAVLALDDLADIVRAAAVEMADRLRETLAADRRALEVVPVDPARIGWSPFVFFESEDQETRWTQWLAAVLRPKNGTRVALAAWRGLCAAIAEACDSTPPAGGDASADAWRRVGAELPTSVMHEEVFEDGRLDLVIRAPGFVSIIENKLWADWHDSPKRLQSDAYARRGEAIRAEERADSLGLVLLTCRREMDRRERWVRLTYARLARHLRRAAQELARGASPTDSQSWIELAPLLLTIRDIEHHLLGVAWDRTAPNGSAFTEVQRLQQVLVALEVETT